MDLKGGWLDIYTPGSKLALIFTSSLGWGEDNSSPGHRRQGGGRGGGERERNERDKGTHLFNLRSFQTFFRLQNTYHDHLRFD